MTRLSCVQNFLNYINPYRVLSQVYLYSNRIWDKTHTSVKNTVRTYQKLYSSCTIAFTINSCYSISWACNQLKDTLQHLFSLCSAFGAVYFTLILVIVICLILEPTVNQHYYQPSRRLITLRLQNSHKQDYSTISYYVSEKLT